MISSGDHENDFDYHLKGSFLDIILFLMFEMERLNDSNFIKILDHFVWFKDISQVLRNTSTITFEGQVSEMVIKERL